MAIYPPLNRTVDYASTAESIMSPIDKGDPETSGSEIKKHVLDTVDNAEIRRAIRTMDLTILPVMAMFYFLSFLVNLFHCILQPMFVHLYVCKDRTNIGDLFPNFGFFFQVGSRNSQGMHESPGCRRVYI